MTGKKAEQFQSTKETLTKSLLSVFRKVFERLAFNSLLNYFIQNNSLSVNLASFQAINVLLNSCKLRMKCTKAVIAIREIQDIRGTFIGISKAFDKVWHKGLISKLKSYGVDDSLSKLIENCLIFLFQKQFILF